jgi:hypothetical protein
MEISKQCLYGGGPATHPKRGVGEHIVPDAIGGVCTLLNTSGHLVCENCNTGPLSHADEELCGRSYLSLVASQELEARLWQAWDIDHDSENLLVEARPRWVDGVLQHLAAYPQIVFEKSGPQIRGDVEEMESFGREKYTQVLLEGVRRTLEAFNKGKRRGLKYEMVMSNAARKGNRYAPRIYAPYSIKEVQQYGKRRQYRLRFITEEDKEFAVKALANMADWKPFTEFKERLGSKVPSFSINYDPVLSMKGLMKIGLNLLAAYCEKTAVNFTSFNEAIRQILEKQADPSMLLAGNGFVKAEGIQDIAVAGAHTFRLVYFNTDVLGKAGQWVIYSCFFGGRIGGIISLPGPDKEEWETLDIAAPINSKEWLLTKSGLFQPLRVQVETTDAKRIVPSLKWQYIQSWMQTSVDPPANGKPPDTA